MSYSGSQFLPDKKRLRWILIGFFLILVIPTGVLVYKSLDQLKWQAVHQYRGLASELSARIDADLSRRAQREANRALGDYSFFSITRGNGTNYRQRSPLAAFPVVAELPGTIGYFQVDANGEFSTPLLPERDPSHIGIAPAELVLRQNLSDQILKILSDNELITPTSPAQWRDRRAEQKRTSDQATQQAPEPARRIKTRADKTVGVAQSKVRAENRAAPAAGTPHSRAAAPEPIDRRAQPKTLTIPKSDAASGRTAAPTSEVSVALQSGSRPMSKPELADPSDSGNSSNFDRLSRESPSQTIGLAKNRSALPKLEELNLDQSLQRRAAQRDRIESALADEQSETDATARSAAVPATSITGAATTPTDAIVTAFESEVDPFALSRLNSGHFVLYRKAWRQGQRLIQGLLIDPARFASELIRPGFISSSMAPISDLTIAFGGSVLTRISGPTVRGYPSSSKELGGSILYESALREPFNNLRLIFSVNQLPTNAGSNLITWMGLLLASILGTGLYGLYRLGKRRLELASQQQDFVAAVSHELKTPLTSIRMYGEMLREGWASEEKKSAYYEFIHDESERLSRLIDNVLQLARMNRDDIQVKLQAVAPAQAIDMIRSRTAATIARAGFTVEMNNHVKDPSGDAKVLMDPDLFVQMMINLIDNAVKFSTKASKRHIEIGVWANDSSFRFTVRDYGPGIAEDQARKVFRLFYRAETELTRETVGTGIGLALVSQLAKAMNGKVDVVNKSPGAEFQVVLPRA